MTRFARARGSKASNERVPEEATPWEVMKLQTELHKFKVEREKEDRKACNIPDVDLNKMYKKRSIPICNDRVWEEFDQNIQPDTSDFSTSACLSNEGQHKLKNKKHNKQLQNKLVKCNKTSTNSCTSTNLNVMEKVKTVVGTFDICSVNEKIPNEGTNTIKNKGKGKNDPNLNNLDSVHIADGKSKINVHEKVLKKKNKRSFHEDTETVNKKIKLDKFDDSPFSKLDLNSEVRNTMNGKNKFASQSSFQGFPVRKEDANRLNELRNDMRAKGVPESTVFATLKTERRKAEKALSRAKDVICFNCRQYGHLFSDCPETGVQTGICFKCGSTEHLSKMCRTVKGDVYKFSRCFICQEQGHISRHCPDNPRGLYPKGGACKFCGDVTHLKSDCPKLIEQQKKNRVTVRTLTNNSIEELDEECVEVKNRDFIKKPGVVKF